MIDTVVSVTNKTGSRGPYQIIRLAGGNSFLSNQKPFVEEGDEIDYETKDVNGYTWSTKVEIVSFDYSLEELKMAELCLKYGHSEVEEVLARIRGEL